MNDRNEADNFIPATPSSGVSRRGLFAAGTAVASVAAFSAATPAVAATTTVDTSYTTDDDSTLRNPERGMYFGRLPASGDSHTLVARWLWLDTVCGANLTWNGLNKSGTSPVLNAYAQQLEACRAAGVKAIFRPRYDKMSKNAPSDCTINGTRVFHADSLARQFNHIDAVAAMLRSYRDVIAYIQAGYLGRWGEWNTDDYPDASAPFLYKYEDRTAIIDRALSAYAAAGIKQDVELRRPVFAKEVINRKPTANVGLHNDCFMTSNSDRGTYSDFLGSKDLGFPPSPANFGSSSAAKTWAQSFTANKSFGGETCPWDGTNERWRKCSNMLTEPATLHTSYLNAEYATDAVATWKAGGCYDEIRRKLGYRFKVKRVEYTKTVTAGQNFTVLIDIENSGWARLHKPRNAQLVLRSGSTVHRYSLSDGATRDWEPGKTKRISATKPAPPAGTYSVRLAIPDPDAPTRIPYAVKLASRRGGVNVFDGNTGENNLGVSITVK